MKHSTKKQGRDLDLHRPNAAVVVFNHKGQVFMGRRAGERGTACWQFPQGGIDQGEKPLAAAFRELEEETGINKKHVIKLGKIKGWVAYDFPKDVRFAPNKRKNWRGQKQKWFAFYFTGNDKHIRLDLHKSIEFDKWAWVDLVNTPGKTIQWKYGVYQLVVKKFTKYERIIKAIKAAGAKA